MDIKRGDIWYIESGYSVGSEQRAGRPAIVVSNNRNNQYSGTVEVVYLTTQPKRDLPTHVTISSLSRESTALCEQITSVSTERFGSYRGAVTAEEMEDIEEAMRPMYTTKPEQDRSGMGFAFMEAFMDSVEVESEPGKGTRVKMKKTVGKGREIWTTQSL